MKKVAILSLMVILLLSLFACGEGTNDTDTTNNAPKVTESQTDKAEDAVQVSKFQQFEQGLTDKAIKFEKNEKSAALVGAKEGWGYIFEDGTAVEVYLFDKGSDAYKEAVKNSKINLASFGITMDVVFNDDVCIYFNGTPTNKTDIETIFSDLK